MMTKSEIILQMRRVSDAMIALASEMTKYAMDNDEHLFADKAIELSGAGRILANWQSAAEKGENLK